MEFTTSALVGIFVKMSIASISFILFGYFSREIVDVLAKGKQASESGPNLEYEAPSRDDINWHIIHIRDDIGSAVRSLSITNGLLGAILVILIIF